MMLFDDEELERYSRQFLLKEIDFAGQEKLRRASAVVIGAGGLGNIVAPYLAGCGFGKLALIDHDSVELSNLHRQIAYGTDCIGVPKAYALADRLAQLNPHCEVESIAHYANEQWLARVLTEQTMLIDCSDNFETRYLTNRMARLHGCTLISGAAIRGEGQVAMFDFSRIDSPCYACLYPPLTGDYQEDRCVDSGVLGPLVGLVGAIQAIEAIKLVVGAGQSLRSQLLVIDAFTMAIRKLKISGDATCQVCRGNSL